MNSLIARCTFWLLWGLIAWSWAITIYRKTWDWPLALLFGALQTLVMFLILKASRPKPAPYQLVLKLANDNGGDPEDERTFEALEACFKHQFSKKTAIKYDGFDSDGSFDWFYFFSSEPKEKVWNAIAPCLESCRIREGSYFVSNATEFCSPPENANPVQINSHP